MKKLLNREQFERSQPMIFRFYLIVTQCFEDVRLRGKRHLLKIKIKFYFCMSFLSTRYWNISRCDYFSCAVKIIRWHQTPRKSTFPFKTIWLCRFNILKLFLSTLKTVVTYKLLYFKTHRFISLSLKVNHIMRMDIIRMEVIR